MDVVIVSSRDNHIVVKETVEIGADKYTTMNITFTTPFLEEIIDTAEKYKILAAQYENVNTVYAEAEFEVRKEESYITDNLLLYFEAPENSVSDPTKWTP
jgi:hypothetical protein